jgi:hypothetical protein
MMPIDEAASVPPIRYRQKFGMSVRPELVPPPSALHRAGRDGVSLPPDVERMFKNAKSFLERATIDGSPNPIPPAVSASKFRMGR